MTGRPGRAIAVAIVDDHPLVRVAIRGILTSAGLAVVAEASSAEQALTLIPEAAPDVALVDIDLPGLDGIRLIRELAPRVPRCRFVMLTVSDDDRDVAEAIRSGARGYLTKDLDPDALERGVRDAHAGRLAMPSEIAGRLIERLLSDNGRRAFLDPATEGLTRRERDVLGLLAEGRTDRQIAELLKLSQRTVETHVSSILHKLGVRNRAEAVRRYQGE